jgi:hypothetical protein
VFSENTHLNPDRVGMDEADEVDAGNTSEKESRSLNDFKCPQQEVYEQHASSTGATPRQQRDSKSSMRSSVASSSNGHNLSTMVNNFLPPNNDNGNQIEDPVISPKLANNYSSRQYYSSSDDSSANECRIIPVERDDYLETLDRKVTEVINQSRISNGGIVASTTTELNRKTSLGRRHQRTKPSPGSAKRIFMKTPSSSDNQCHLESSSNCILDDNLSNGNTVLNTSDDTRITSYLPSIVRFDETNGNNNQDASSDTQESSQERWSDGDDAQSEEEGNLDDRNIIRRRSTARRPIRSKNRRSISSIHSAVNSTASSTEEGNTSEYPCSSSQRSTLGSRGPEFNTQQLVATFNMAASIVNKNSNNNLEQTSIDNGNISTSELAASILQTERELKVQSLEYDGPSEEDEETEIASQAPSLTPRQLPSLTLHPL